MTSAANDPLEGLTPEQRLQKLGIELPPAAPAVGDYAPTAIAGSLLMTSGQTSHSADMVLKSSSEASAGA